MKKMKYRYGVVLFTNDKNWFENLGGIKNGIYVAIETPKEMDHKIMNINWLDHFLKSSKTAIRKKLWSE